MNQHFEDSLGIKYKIEGHVTQIPVTNIIL